MDENEALTRELMTCDPITKQYDRTIAGSDSAVYRFATEGWSGDSLIWIGKALRNSGETPMKEIIHKIDLAEFEAVFYVKDGPAWTPVSWERLKRMD